MSVEERNRLASDPRSSVWVTANAGSGKTHLLVDRIIRLLLSGTPPARLLCLTFTKAAASEMSRRLFERLSEWIAKSDEQLTDDIVKMAGRVDFKPAHARRLFAEALETPGGLKIQTIHAFCERLLQRFPLEAGVVPGFSVLDDAAADELLAATQEEVLSEAAKGEDAELAGALGVLVARVGARDFEACLKEMLKHREHVAGLSGDMRARYSRALEMDADDHEAAIHADFAQGLNRALFRELAQSLPGAKNKSDAQKAATAALLGESEDPAALFAAARKFCLTKDDTIQVNILTKKFADAAPHVLEPLQETANQVLAGLERLHSLATRDASLALFTIAKRIFARVEAEKRRRGLLGYDDLIERTRQLFATAQGPWVLFKLDGGLDHVLIDEAQDTSPAQWDVIARLTEEFFAGAGARDGARTLFVVGDEKQSIYSFQGADPVRFAAMREHFNRSAQAADEEFRVVPLEFSWRSTAPVLQAVDWVWRGESQSPAAHLAKRQGQQGLVEIWPAIGKPEKAETAAWHAPQAVSLKEHPRMALAQRIAGMIGDWIRNKETLTARKRPITPGDILILLRNRGSGKAGMMDAILAALKQQGLPVAGADRLKLASHIGVLDLLALARFALNPEDDLSLAALLKSPIPSAAWDEAALLAAASARQGQSLWQRVGAPQKAELQAILDRASASPYDFYAHVLFGTGAYHRLIGRLGAEAAEPLDAFMAKCLDYERDHAPSLGGFLAWMDAGASEIKRDMDSGGGEIRVMTVHGSKGLEAPVVILPDTCDMPDGSTMPSIYLVGEGGDQLPIWRLSSAALAPVVVREWQRVRQAQQEEYARLLYVAMTRAGDRLYVMGAKESAKLKEGCWYDKIEKSLKPHWQEHQLASGETVYRIGNKQTETEPFKKGGAESASPVRSAPPAWALRNPPAEGSLLWLTPSGIGSGEAHASPRGEDAVRRFKRGEIIHTLLQYLPELPEAERPVAAARYLARPGLGVGEADQRQIAEEVMRLLTAEGFAGVFGPGSLAEVPLAALLGDGKGLSGRMDRIAFMEREVLIVDYKTNRPPPSELKDVPPQYIAQLDAYRQALRPLFPGKTIRTALIWTDGPRFMEVPASQP